MGSLAAAAAMGWGCPNGGGGWEPDGSVDADEEIDADLSQFDHPVRAARVIDGDTLVVRKDGESIHVRLIGVNCPEISPEPEPYGTEAAEFTSYHVPDLTWIGLEFDDEACAAVAPPSHCLDTYDRLLAYIRTADGEDLGYILLANGLAQVYDMAEFDRKTQYYEAEDYARNLGVGIWSQ
jgi:endonuclease YncB( thermonuclease family)